MFRADALESAILNELGLVGACTLEELNERLPYYSWNQVLAALDWLTREGIVTPRGADSSNSVISLASPQPFETQPNMQQNMST